MTNYQRLVAIAAGQHGLVTSADAVAEGIQRVLLVQMARNGTLERAARGIYRIPELAGDPLAQYQEAILSWPGAVLSHETALDLHDLCDVNPRRVDVTVPPGTRIKRSMPAWLIVHRRALDPGDVTDHAGLAITTPARSIIDAIDDDLGARFVEQAIETARQRNLLTTREDQRVERALLEKRAAQLSQVLG
jgi:predicted transcriptional regulator of viral defense system